MSSAIEFNKDFGSKGEFKKKNSNKNLLNEKSEIYDDLLKDRGKNLKKLSKLMNETEKTYTPFMETSLHRMILNTITTLEKLLSAVQKKGFNIRLNFEDKLYLGVACGLISILLLLISS
jgi:hypothetical protein